MSKKGIYATAAIFVAWSVLDWLIHGVLLASAYASTPNLWRPQEEMILWLIYFASLVGAGTFVYIYDRFFADKGVGTGVAYGIVFGIGAGISMGYGSYAVMPLPYSIALGWFLGTLVEATVAGLLVGLIVKE